MNRRAALGLLTAAAAGLLSRLGWASPTASAAGESFGFRDLKQAESGERVISIAWSPGAYSVGTSDGRSQVFLEANLRFKVDSSRLGPRPGAPVILSSGREGDRKLVLFASPEELDGFMLRAG